MKSPIKHKKSFEFDGWEGKHDDNEGAGPGGWHETTAQLQMPFRLCHTSQDQNMI